MRILIIDDSADKLRRLLTVLQSSGVDRASIDVSRSSADALAKLRGTSYDIAILDLLLPARDEDEARLETSLDLLREINEHDELRKPAHLIGFTAYPDAEAAAQPYFSKTLWTVVRFDPTSDAWEEQFRRVVEYVESASVQPRTRVYEVDLCILTALQVPELAAVHNIPWRWEPPEPMDDSTFVRRGRFSSNGHEFQAISACAPRMGNVAAALLTAKVIERYKPRFVVMAGICAGIKLKVNLGDVVLFSPCWEWASGKVVPDEDEGSYLEPAPHQIPVAEFVLARAEQFRADGNYWLTLRDGFPSQVDGLPKLVIAPAASGPSIVAYGDYAESLKLQHRKLTAIDMEAYGLTSAAQFGFCPKTDGICNERHMRLR